MQQQEYGTEHNNDGGASSDWATRAIRARVEEWASDRVLDPGDSHDKGEASLCVGEAA